MANVGNTNVPGVTFGTTGFLAPSEAAILAGVQADINAAFGGSLSYSLTTPQGQLASSMTAVIGDTDAIFTYFTNQVNPAFATGRMQDAIAAIYFITRNPSQPTVLQLACQGLEDVPIPVGAVVSDSANNLYMCVSEGTIPASGTVTLPFAAQLPGPTAVPASVKIYQAIPGWDSAAVISGVVGNPVESRAQFEARRQLSVAKNSIGSLPSILGAVLAVSNVLDAYVTENVTGSPLTVGGFTLAPHSVYVAVSGGTDAAVAQAIWSKKAPGCNYNGNTTVVVTDSNSGYSPPLPTYNVTFERPTTLPILLAVSIPNTIGVPADAAVQIQNAVISAFNGNDGGPRARIGSVIYASRFAAPITALGTWASIISLNVGSNNTPSANFRGFIAGTTLSATATISGTVGVGQTVSGPGITVGTQIVGLGTDSGGTGTYLVSQTQTVSGAVFTGIGSGIHLTASAVTGTINIGDIIAGTGVPGGTSLIAQVSGTVGGAGVYTTSGATTASGSTITCSALITSAVADQNLVAVNISQEPTIDPADIYLTLV